MGRKVEEGRGKANAVGARRPPSENHVIPPPAAPGFHGGLWHTCEDWQVRGDRWKGKVGKAGISFGNFVFLGLRSNSGIRAYGDGNSYLDGDDGRRC